MKDFYSVNELAEQLGVTTRSIRNYLHEGKLKGTKVGGQWKFSERNLFEFLYGDQADEAAKDMQRFMLDTPITMRFNLQYRDFTAINQFREQAEILIGGNFNYVTNFSQWINGKLLMQTDISLVS
ncbi:excisionase family DNA binding domain-containing protein [Enterococcus faecium EnGen0056]|uniref:helix-turn-helix domain-containing protein n=1 Tax=Enterococcus faecium TaxID=1352 RepID=UPI0002A3C813|nr:helix-turn-helix domain-containing protein [Enterococcus faecium]ELB57575.1 excisionase family DNA binding domain-containing protein [Enterococcus faecium EnGen0056]